MRWNNDVTVNMRWHSDTYSSTLLLSLSVAGIAGASCMQRLRWRSPCDKDYQKHLGSKQETKVLGLLSTRKWICTRIWGSLEMGHHQLSLQMSTEPWLKPELQPCRDATKPRPDTWLRNQEIILALCYRVWQRYHCACPVHEYSEVWYGSAISLLFLHCQEKYVLRPVVPEDMEKHEK